ncbi:MAG: ABC transporter permease, partial [Pseudaminobacter sp.]|nr:ABC transporter permease [Pseudaminobacter sp.]
MLTNARKEASASAADHGPFIAEAEEGAVLTCALSGIWTTRTIAPIDAAMRKIERREGFSSLVVDLSEIEKMDTAGAWLIERLTTAMEARGIETSLVGQSEIVSILLEAVGDASRKERDVARQPMPNILIRALAGLGRAVYAARDDFVASMGILGATIRGGQMKLGRGHGVNPAAIFNQIDRMGVGAIPVVVLMSAIVGAIVAQQGAFQLRYFGADIFVVDLVGILVLRELGVLMTAIMIAGRSGSAITAEIGSMKMREEVDALTVIGLNPVGVLVFP